MCGYVLFTIFCSISGTGIGWYYGHPIWGTVIGFVVGVILSIVMEICGCECLADCGEIAGDCICCGDGDCGGCDGGCDAGGSD